MRLEVKSQRWSRPLPAAVALWGLSPPSISVYGSNFLVSKWFIPLSWCTSQPTSIITIIIIVIIIFKI